MHLILRRYALLALSILGSATLLFSCTKETKATEYDYETLMTESSENRTISMMENGMRSYTFVTPLMEGYSLATNPYQEFRRGIDMTTYTQDSLNLVDATITANYAIYYENQKLWEAKGNVTIVKNNREEGDTVVKSQTEIYTQQLFWNATTKKIYSNVDTKILQPDGWHFGVGFDADEDLKNIHFRKYSSEIEFDMSQPTAEELAAEEKKNEEAAAKSEGGKSTNKGDIKRDPKDANRGGANRGNTPSVNKPNNTIKPQPQRPNNTGNQPIKPNVSPTANMGRKDQRPTNGAPNGVTNPNNNLQNKQKQNNLPKNVDISTNISTDVSLDGSRVNKGAMEAPAKRK
ncbi:MAG: LPS export ABC transporter periplasmic protein LptC [Alistipes sp.]|nr:LPS export ABC transporter periplasmic protein LptC [Alistipes sp.]